MAGSLLRNFSRFGVVLEGNGPRLMAAAAAVMAVGALSADPAQARNAGAYQEQLPTAQLVRIPDREGGRNERMAELRARAAKIPYAKILADVRRQVEAEYPGQVYIVDRSKPPQAEAARIAAITNAPIEAIMPPMPRGAGPGPLSGTPHSTNFNYGPKKDLCIIVGAEPWASVADLTSRVGIDYKAGMVTEEFAHEHVFWHELGHCLKGASEATADAFGSLKMMSKLGTTKPIEYLAAARELDEWLGRPGDTHFISAADREVLKTYGNAAFMKAPHTLHELAELAGKIAEPDRKVTAAFRDSFAQVRFAPDQPYFVPVKEGYVTTTLAGYVKASSSVPEFSRISSLINYLQSDPETRVLPGAFKPDQAASARSIATLALAGDPVARRVAPVFGVKTANSDRPVAANDTLPASADVEGQVISFSRVDAVVKFSKDLYSFLVRNAKSNAPVLAGNSVEGVTKKFAGAHLDAGPSPAYGDTRSRVPIVPVAHSYNADTGHGHDHDADAGFRPRFGR